MKLSMRGDYGLRAVLELARRYGEGPVQSAEIAAHQGIPEQYLDHLLTVLRKAGIVKSARGPQGGHVLVRQPEELTLGEVLAVLEGSLAVLGCVEDPHACRASASCVLRDVWRQIGELTRGVLDGTTIAELTRRQQDAGRRLATISKGCW